MLTAGAFLRFWQIWRFPVGFHFDEAANLIDIWRLGPAYHPIYFTANNGREPLWFYWAAPFVSVLGSRPQAMNLASAFLGVLTLPAVYFCFAHMLRKPEGVTRARTIALFAAAGCAFLFMHVNLSRIGLRTISLPLAECLAFGLMWLAVRRQRTWLFLLAGLLFATCLYTYTTARLLVALLPLYGLYWLARNRRIEQLQGWLVWLAGFLAGALPLAVYGITHPEVFLQRTEGLALTDGVAVWQNVLAMLKWPLVEGSLNGAHNIVGMPLFDWPMRLAFVVGLAMLLARLRRPEYVFALLWLGIVALASVFSPDAPYYIRLTALIPPAVLIPALALAEAPRWLRRFSWRWLPSLAIVAASFGLAYDHYFRVWAPSNDTYFWMMQDKVDAGNWIARQVRAGAQVFEAPLLAQDWTYQALGRSLPLQSFDPAQCWVLPPAGGDAVYTFPSYDPTQPGLLLPHLPITAIEQPIVNDHGQPVLIEVRVPGRDLSAPATNLLGNFGGQIGLARVEGLPSAALRPGDSLQLTLVWQALAPPAADYTGYVHADDTVHHLRAQQDHMPCGGSFPTTRWHAGDQVFDRYTVTIPKNAPDGTYQLTVGLYSLPGPRNLTLAGSSQTDLAVGSLRVGS